MERKCELHLNSDDTPWFLLWRPRWQPAQTLLCLIVSCRKLLFSFICVPPSFPQTLHTCASLFNNWKLVKASCWGKERHFVILPLFLSSYGGSFLQAATEEVCQNQKMFRASTREFGEVFQGRANTSPLWRWPCGLFLNRGTWFYYTCQWSYSSQALIIWSRNFTYTCA